MTEKYNPPYPMGQPPSGAYPQQGAYPHMQPPPSYDTSYNQSQQAFIPNQPGFVSPQQPPPIVQQPQFSQTVYVNAHVGPDPCSITCPSCRNQIVTRLEYETSTKTHLMAALLCAFVCWPCAWIPYVMDSCKNANHYCPSCGAFIGTYKS